MHIKIGRIAWVRKNSRRTAGARAKGHAVVYYRLCKTVRIGLVTPLDVHFRRWKKCNDCSYFCQQQGQLAPTISTVCSGYGVEAEIKRMYSRIVVGEGFTNDTALQVEEKRNAPFSQCLEFGM